MRHCVICRDLLLFALSSIRLLGVVILKFDGFTPRKVKDISTRSRRQACAQKTDCRRFRCFSTEFADPLASTAAALRWQAVFGCAGRLFPVGVTVDCKCCAAPSDPRLASQKVASIFGIWQSKVVRLNSLPAFAFLFEEALRCQASIFDSSLFRSGSVGTIFHICSRHSA